MIAKIEVERFSLTSSRPFDEVLAAIKGVSPLRLLMRLYSQREA